MLTEEYISPHKLCILKMHLCGWYKCIHIIFHVDQRIVDWLSADFKRDEGIDLLKDKQALQRLTETAEKAKMELSSLTQTNIRLDSVVPMFSLSSLCSF